MAIQPSEVTINVPDTEEGKELKEAIALTLWQKGIYTKSQAAELLNITIREFHDVIVKNGLPISGTSNDDVLDMYSQSLSA